MLKITLKQLEVFAAVAECSSFTLAAQQLYMTQSTVSIHVAALEHALGASVLERENRKRISLTPMGQTIYDYACQILTLSRELEQSVAQKEPDRLRIGASSVPAQCLLPDLMASFIRQDGSCAFVLRKGDTTAIHDLLRSREIRIGFVGAALDRVNLGYLPLMDDQLVVITPNSARFARLLAQGVAGDGLLREPVILREPESGSRKEFEGYLQQSGIRLEDLNLVAEIDQPQTILESVARGVGISVVSARFAAKAVQEGKLLTFPLGTGFTRGIYLATLKDFTPTPAEAAFLAFTRAWGER